MSDRKPEPRGSRPSVGARAAAFDESRLVRRAVSQAQLGDSEGLHFLFVRFSPDVLRYVVSVVHDHHEAEDITQNVFAKLVTAIHKYERREAPFAAWILTVARNAALDHLRAKRAIPTKEVRIDDENHAHASFDRSRLLRHALAQLPDDQRKVLMLRHVFGFSPAEIASALDRSESSVHGLHHRGRRKLRASLVELGAAPVVTSRPAA